MPLCGDNEGILRFLLKYSIAVHHNRLVLEQWIKRWITVSSSKFQNQQSDVLCLQNKKAFKLWYRVLCKILQLRIYCGQNQPPEVFCKKRCS